MRLVIIDPVQAFIGADVDMNRANEVRPVFRKLGMIAEKTGCAIALIGHLNKSSGTQSAYRGLEGKATETKLERGAKLIRELLADKKEISIRELDEKAKEQGIF